MFHLGLQIIFMFVAFKWRYFTDTAVGRLIMTSVSYKKRKQSSSEYSYSLTCSCNYL